MVSVSFQGGYVYFREAEKALKGWRFLSTPFADCDKES